MNQRIIRQTVGRNSMKKIQVAIIIVAVIFSIFVIVEIIIYRNKNAIAVLLIGDIFFSLLLFTYSKIYNINFDTNFFYINNIFSKKVIRTEDFEQISAANSISPNVFSISFKENGKYQFMLNEDETWKMMKSKDKKKYANDLTYDLKLRIHGVEKNPQLNED